jgi:hypothetical protein
VEHQDVGVLNVELDVGDVLYAEQVLGGVVLYDILATLALFSLFYAYSLQFLLFLLSQLFQSEI